MKLEFDKTLTISAEDIPPNTDVDSLASAIQDISAALKISGKDADIETTIKYAKELLYNMSEASEFIRERFPMYSKDETDIVAGFAAVQYQKVKEDFDSFSAFLEYVRVPIEATLQEARNLVLPTNTPMIESLIATSHVMPNNKLMNTMTQDNVINFGPFDMVVSNETKKQKEITSYTIITYSEEENDDAGIKISPFHLTEYERQVSDAIISLWVEAEKQGKLCIITTDMIYRAMPGSGDKPSPQRRGAITRAIQKLRNIKVYVDFSEEMRRRGKNENNKKFELDEDYLVAGRFLLPEKNGGQYVYCYRIYAEPVVYRYAKMMNQVLTVPAKYIEIKKVKGGKITTEPVAMTEGRVSMTGYMLRRILVIKRDLQAAQDALRAYNNRRKKNPALEEKPIEAFRKQSDTILFETIFNETGTETTDRKRAKLNRDFCFDVLDYWTKSGLIGGYNIQKKGASITGMKILFNGPALKPGKQKPSGECSEPVTG